jgi:hypothetical protein
VSTEEERFWVYVDKSPLTGCWRWMGYTQPDGYGRFRSAAGRTVSAHRFAYEMLVGPIPEGLTIDHLCRIRPCVNPAHLEPVTHRENVLRGETVTAANAAKTHCAQGHAYDEANTYTDAKGSRHCRSCNRECQRIRRTATKARP